MHTSFESLKQSNAGVLTTGYAEVGPAQGPAAHFTGPYAHRALKGIGHSVPQEAPESFAEAVVDVDGF